jgi:hypothetical protein
VVVTLLFEGMHLRGDALLPETVVLIVGHLLVMIVVVKLLRFIKLL